MLHQKRREAPAFMPGMDRRWARRAQCPRAQQDPRSARALNGRGNGRGGSPGIHAGEDVPVLPHFVLRYRQMRPDVARDALLATHGGMSLELCAVLYHISPMALSRLICAFGHQSLVPVLTRCGLPLPVYFLADEKHSRALTAKVYLPTIVCGRVLWHLGYTEAASTAAFTQSYREFQQAALQQEPSYRVRGILTDGFDSTT